jgi:hypothetical protein
MVFLSFVPAYAGHSIAGGYGYCECNEPERCTIGQSFQSGTQSDDNQQIIAPNDETTELETLIKSFFVWLDIRA